MDSTPNMFKAIFIGDNGVGKTSLLHCIYSHFLSSPSDYVPGSCETVYRNLILEDLIDINKWDTPGGVDPAKQDNSRVRPLVSTPIYIICYASDSPQSFVNAEKKWAVEARQRSPNAKLFLVCTKKDLRPSSESSQSDFICTEAGEDLAQRLSAVYHETSVPDCDGPANIQIALLSIAEAGANASAGRKGADRSKGCAVM